MALEEAVLAGGPLPSSSPDGNELWVARYNGPASAGDVATALAPEMF